MQLPAHERFAAFHAENPHVYERLRDLALRARARRSHVGIRLLWERLRWDYIVETIDPNSMFKLNDHYKEFYGRLLEEREPSLVGFFTRRRSRADAFASVSDIVAEVGDALDVSL